GHSDGATIAMHFLGAHEDHRVSGAILLAPHFFVEDESISAISAARDAFNGGNLRERLAPYHSDVDVAFRGWNNAWLDPGFRDWDVTETIAYPRVPILALQGSKDPYGTRAQIDVIAEEAYCPVETRLLRGVRHAPHLEATADTLDTIATFITRVDRLEQFGADPRQAPSATV
ncbi:MAG: alpha/beta hydrolase, partial [Pseudomonadota bacterium]